MRDILWHLQHQNKHKLDNWIMYYETNNIEPKIEASFTQLAAEYIL